MDFTSLTKTCSVKAGCEMPSVTQALISDIDQVIERIASPSAWCQGASAMDALGSWVSPNSPKATRWCLTGAMQREVKDPVRRMTLTHAVQSVTASGLADYNDHSTHEEVQGALRKTRDQLQPAF